MAREFPLWVIVALPWFAALVCLLLARLQVRSLGPRKAVVFAHYLALGASAMALLFIVQSIQHLLAPDDPRALAHTPLRELVPPIVIGKVRIELMLVADRLSTCTALVIAGAFTLARMFIAGPAGQRELGVAGDSASASAAIRRLGLLGLLEGAALLFVLASDLGLAAVGWAVLGVGAAVAVAGPDFGDERASAATRVLVASLAGDLALGFGAVVLVLSGIGLAHNEMWAPLTGDHLYELGLFGVTTADLVATGLVVAALLRTTSLAWAGNSLTEAMLDAVVVPIPAVYLLVRYERVLAYAPTVLAVTLVFGILLALIAAAVGLVRPARGLARRNPRSGVELGLAGTGLAWVGLITIAVGVGAWRSAVLLVLAQALGRLGLRLALLVANGEQLPPWTARVARLLGWAVAGVAPGLGFVAIAQTLLDVLTRNSVLAPWISWLGAGAVLLVAFAHSAAIARIWYEQLGRKPGSIHRDVDEDGLDFAPLLLLLLGLVVLGVHSLGAWFGLSRPILSWLDLVLPLAGGHELAPLGIRPEFRTGISVARPWVAGSGVLVALVTGFAWMWARERFRRPHGAELSNLATALELALALPRRVVWTTALVLDGVTELAARGIGRGVFEEGPRIGKSLARDSWASLRPRVRKLALGGPRQALLGVILGLALLLGWLYAKRDVASVLPSDDYGWGGLRPKLIKAGGNKARASEAPTAEQLEQLEALEAESSPVAPGQLAPRRDGAEPAPLVPEEAPR